MATHSSVLAWRIPGAGEPGGLPSMRSHRVRHNWSDLAAAAAAVSLKSEMMFEPFEMFPPPSLPFRFYLGWILLIPLKFLQMGDRTVCFLHLLYAFSSDWTFFKTSIFKSRDITLPTKVHLVKAMFFPVVMYGCESWTVKKAEHRKNWCFWTVVLKTLESPLDCKEIQPVHRKGDQSWVFIGRIDVETNSNIYWYFSQKSWFQLVFLPVQHFSWCTLNIS